MKGLWIALVTVALGGGWAGAADPSVGTGNGGVRRGAGTAAFSDDGRLSVYVGAEPLIQNASIGCGLGGYMTSDKFSGRKVKRELGRYSYQAMLPGHDVRFSVDAAPEGEGLRVTIKRDGEWPVEAAWCSFQFLVPVAVYGGGTMMADGKPVVLPLEKPQNNTIVGNVKQIALAADDPKHRLLLASDAGIVVTDGRQWNTPAYQISIGINGGPHAQTTFTLVFPEGSKEQLRPRLCVSPMGYSAHGLKEVTMEWPAGMERPGDGVRLEDTAGKSVASGHFGPTISYQYMQNSFATFAFANVTAPGKYKVVWDGGAAREIEIKPTVFAEAVWGPTLGVFVPWQMCHANITFADGSWPDLPACHMDDGQRVPANFPGIDGYRSYECNLTPFTAGDMISCGIGGWHDAGDYDLNVHAQGHTTWKLALTYEEFGVTYDNTTIDIEKQSVIVGKPDGVPDILQQVQWGARWLLTMQQKDGLVYPGVCCRPGGQYTADVSPEKLSDGKPGTGDERYVYVDYQPDSQLAQVISLAAVGRVLAKMDPALSQRCIASARQAYAYYTKGPHIYRPNTYFSKRAEDGEVGAHAAALAELYLTTHEAEYLKALEVLAPQLDSQKVTWPAAYGTGCGGWWYAPPVLARLMPQLADGELKSAILRLCQRAVQEQQSESSPRPWPLQWWHLLDWGAGGHCLNRAFDAYYLQRVVPNAFKLEDTQREMLWMLGYHPLSDAVFVCGISPESTKYQYNGRLHGRYGDAMKSVPGAVVPGMGGVEGAGLVVYSDRHGNYYHNEACIYSAADYLFAVQALKAAGY